AIAAAPGAGAVVAVQPAGARGPLVAVADTDVHGAVVAHPAIDGDRRVAGIQEGAAGNPDRIAIGAVAGAVFGYDHDAPQPVIVRGRGRGRRKAAQRRYGEGQRASQGEIPKILLRLGHEPTSCIVMPATAGRRGFLPRVEGDSLPARPWSLLGRNRFKCRYPYFWFTNLERALPFPIP